MRKRALILFSMLCICVFGVARYVGPMAAEDETENTPAVTAALQAGQYLFQNVATGKFLGAANSWGTQASLTDNPEYQTLVLLENGKYHLESQVANGNGSHYFNGTYLDSPDAIELDIQKQENGYFTISNGNVYYGYDGSSAIVSGLETTAADVNVQWSIVSLEAATATLVNATASAPQNATFLLADPNFGRNNRYFSAWTFESTNKDNNGDVKNFCVESWHANFALSQTIQVPNGVYSLAAQGFYRQEGSDYEHLPVFFANGETRVFPEITFGENSMSEVSLSFLRGNYKIKPIYVVVTDGSLEVGARLTGNGNLWCIWDDFTLKYYGTDASVVGRMRFADRFDDIVAQARSKQQTEGITAEANTLLGEALTAYESIDESASAERQDEVEAGLKNAIDVADEGLTLTTQLRKAYDSYGEKLAATGLADNSLIVVLANIQSALNNQEYESRAQVSDWLEQLTSARKEILPYEYRYWFDNDAEAAITDFSSQASWHMDVVTDGLSESFHLLHIQVMDDSESWSTPISRPFVKMLSTQDAQGSYWFDNDYSSRRTASITNSLMDVDVASLADGFHSLHYMAVASAGVSTVHTAYFQKLSGTLAFDYRMWDSEDPEQMITGKLNGNALQVNVEHLTDGFHTLYVQVVGTTSASVPQTAMFIKVPQTIGVDYLNCLMLVDGKLYSHEQVSNQGGTVAWNLDVDSLTQGLHRYLVQVVTPSGAGSSMKEGFFFRVPTESELGALRCCYMVDADSAVIQAGTVANGLYHFDLDVAKLTDGLHKIAYWLVSENGGSTTVNATYFMKIPVGGTGIIQYEYWLNDLDSDKHVAKLQERQDPFSLMTLLPVETQPIRSSNFQFAIKNGQPLIYARNEIHLRFYDASGRFTQITKEFVDEQVTGSVESVGELQATQTFGRPTDGNIRWYWLEAEKGDQLEFKSDKACTIQLFSPSAEEIYKADGSTSVVFGGTHAGETGKYYLAVHDVTATSGTNLTFSYNHLDKFAVLDYSASEWGVLPGVQMMSVSGNGLDCVKSVVLTHGEYKIKADTIIADSKAEAHVVFVLNGDEEFGDYDLIFHFDNGESTKDITVGNAVTLTEPHFGDIDIAITDPRSVASPYPVTIKVTNTSNLTYSHIPFYMAYDNVSKITDMRLLNFDVEADQLLVDSGLVFIHDIEDFKQKGVSARMIPAVIPTLMPGETQTYRLGFKAGNHATYNVYAWTGTPWNLFANETMTAIQALAQSGSGYSGGTGGGSGCSDGGSGNGSGSGSGGGSGTGSSSGSGGGSGTGSSSGSGTGSGVGGGTGGNGGFVSIVLPGGGSGGAGANVSGGVATSCMPDPCGYAGVLRSWIEECTCATALGLGQVLAGIHNALHNRSNRAQREQLAASGLFDNPYEYFPDYYLPNPNDIFNNWLGHCIPYPGVLGKVMSGLNAFQNTFGGMPCPDPRPHPCNQWNPGDPNEIYGYLSEANSKFIADSIQLVKYTIEFENDTSLANASAHIITVRDTLDARYLDRSSFVPTGLKLGTHELTLENVDLEVSEGVTSFVKTIDMRPEIYAIAQVEGTYSQQTGIAEWRFTSLDPMTMEPTDDIMQGILPVNYDGTSGIGEVMFEIGVKANKGDGAQIANRAGIVFDYEETILTPTWVNTVDAVPPTSTILGGIQTNDSTLTLRLAGEDARSGVWRYNVYAQFGAGTSWELVAENVTDTLCDVRIYEDIDYSFCVLATDSAGNVERKEFQPEFSLSSDLLGDANGDGNIDLTDAIMITYHSLGAAQPGLDLNAADVNRDGVVDLTDAITVVYRSLGTENGGAGQGSGAEPE